MGGPREKVLQEVESIREEILRISRYIYDNPELGSEEHKAARLLSSTLRNYGFSVQENFLGMETAFKATYSGLEPKPRMALLAEYDALPSLGHACGHNLIAATAVGSGIAVSRIVTETKKGTVIVLGTPAEEGMGKDSMSKIAMVKQGVFSDVDLAMMIHPSSRNTVMDTSLALEDLEIEFVGRPAHAAASPEKGINALDAMILTFDGINALRQHVTSDVRVHGIITEGGKHPAIIPEKTVAKFLVRAGNVSRLKTIVERVKSCAKGAAEATGSEVEFRTTGKVREDTMPNPILATLLAKNMGSMGMNVEGPRGTPGSTDFGNVSHAVPSVCASVAIAQPHVAGHTHEFMEASGSDEANEATIRATKAIALTCVDLLTSDKLMNDVKTSFEKMRKENNP